MIKYLFILINSLSLFIFSLFNGDGGIVITSNIPTYIKTGEEVQVEVKIFKEGISGFAKYQLNLPEGFSVKSVDDLGAEFTTDNQTVKWVWATLPESEEMSLKFTLMVNELALGAKTISSSFEYIEYNEKKSAEDPGVQITVIKGDSVASAPPITIDSSAPVTMPDTSQKQNKEVAIESHAEPNGSIELIRTVSKTNTPRELMVNLKIKKGLTSGFARYSDDLLVGITAKAIKTDGSSFSVSDGKLKFVWVNVPEKSDLEVSYLISSASLNEVILSGEYSYLENNQSKKVMLQTDTIAFSLPSEVKGNVVEKPFEPQKNMPSSEEPNKPVTTSGIIEKKEGRANYHIQIGAFTNKNVSAAMLKTKFNIEENIDTEFHDSFSKFMIGTYIDYKKARDKRELVKNGNGVKSAFVVAYNDGKRITVQEALMTSNQKWFK